MSAVQHVAMAERRLAAIAGRAKMAERCRATAERTPAMTGGSRAMTDGVQAAAHGFWQWLMELAESFSELLPWRKEPVESPREFQPRLKDYGGD